MGEQRGSRGEQRGSIGEHGGAEREHIDETGVSEGAKRRHPESASGHVLAWVRGYYIYI